MATFLLILGAAGSLASLLALWQAAPSIRSKIAHVLYVFVIGITFFFAADYKNELDAIKSIEREANTLVQNRRMNFSDDGFIAAALSFLEKHKNEFPGSYERAQQICEKNGCFQSAGLNYNAINVASTMDGILRGIATMSAK